MDKIAFNGAQCSGHLASVEDALYVIGGKWKLRIITALLSGHIRFNDLQRTINGISARVLSNELKQLELNGLVKRLVHTDSTPVSIEYQPTAYATTLSTVLIALGDWGKKHREKITAK